MYLGSLPRQSNRADWRGSFAVTDAENGDGIDLTGYSVVLAVYDQGCCWSGSPLINISATITAIDTVSDTRIGYPQIGVITWRIPKSDLSRFCAGTYDVGLTLTDANGETTQLFVGTVPFLSGNVP